MDRFLTLDEVEEEAKRRLDANALGYYSSGADAMNSLLDNRAAFKRIRLLPRMLVDVSNRSLQTTALKTSVRTPIGVAPTAMQRMASTEGELASARAAEKMGGVFVLSTIATSSIEEVAQAAPNATKWFQLYIYRDRELTLSLVRRAEQCGFKALVLTVDAAFFGRRLADIRNAFKLPEHLSMANFKEVGGDLAERAGQNAGGSGINEYVKQLFDPTLSWSDVEWLRAQTNLPIVLKGILRPEDALRGLRAGAKAIWVSNHGARQVDYVPAPIDCLDAIKSAVGEDVEVYLDGGVREGTDVLKALALGAKLVFVGRPIIYGLAVDGFNGALKVLQMLDDELDRAMALCGYSNVQDLDQRLVVKSHTFIQ